VSRILHWFRSDLRVHDNTALAAACGSGEVVGLFIATPDQWDLHNDALIKRDYWRRNLLALESSLKALGIPLLFAQGNAYAGLPGLFEQLLPALKISAVHCNREYPQYELRRDAKVAATCKQLGVDFQQYNDQTLVPPERILNKSGLPFKVFTPYAKTVREHLQNNPWPVPLPLQAQTTPHLNLPACCVSLEQLTWPAASGQWSRLWPAGEQFAHDQLTKFCNERMVDYKNTRDLPALAGTSGISHMLAAGVLSVRQCWRESQQWQDGTGALTWQNELLWRDFYKTIMWYFPHVCRHLAWKHDVGHVPWRHDKTEFRKWCEGSTGIPIIDAAMRQLVQTGWMHNRLRMITAMFLSKHLLMDWRWGERFFMQHLIDGDFSANNGGWQWSASTGTDAAPYFRIFNPVTQSRRFDADGEFLRRYLPELAHLDNKLIHDPGMFRPDTYPAPMLELGFGRERALNAFKLQVP